MKNITVTDQDAGTRLDRYLRRTIGPVGQGLIEKALRGGKIRVNSQKARAAQRLQAGENISIDPYFLDSVEKQANKASEKQDKPTQKPAIGQQQAAGQIEQMTLAHTKSWRALNKPSGLAVQGGTGTVKHIDGLLGTGFPSRDYKLVHRIDKDTSGILLIADGHQAAKFLTAGFHDHTIKKFYLAIVVGMPPASGVISARLHKSGGKGFEKMVVNEQEGQQAVTDFICLDRAGVVSLVGFSPRTGRTHQLRAHAAHIGTPILGDGKYGGAEAHIGGFDKKLHLHAWGLKLPEGQELFAPPPAHFEGTASFAGLTLPDTEIFPCFGFLGKSWTQNRKR